jgi:hypothetical protein
MAALIAEARRAFTLNGKQVPPEIFRDFGDGDLADSGTIWVTIRPLSRWPFQTSDWSPILILDLAAKS